MHKRVDKQEDAQFYCCRPCFLNSRAFAATLSKESIYYRSVSDVNPVGLPVSVSCENFDVVEVEKPEMLPEHLVFKTDDAHVIDPAMAMLYQDDGDDVE